MNTTDYTERRKSDPHDSVEHERRHFYPERSDRRLSDVEEQLSEIMKDLFKVAHGVTSLKEATLLKSDPKMDKSTMFSLSLGAVLFVGIVAWNVNLSTDATAARAFASATADGARTMVQEVRDRMIKAEERERFFKERLEKIEVDIANNRKKRGL